MPKHGAEVAEGGFHIFSVDDFVEHADAVDKFGGLEVIGDFEDLSLGADAGASEADKGFGFGEDDVGDGSVTREDARHCGVGENGDVGYAVLPAFIDSGSCFGHLHEAEKPFLHSCAAGSAEDNDGTLEFDTSFQGAGDFFAVDGAHGAAHEVKVGYGGGDELTIEAGGAAD